MRERLEGLTFSNQNTYDYLLDHVDELCSIEELVGSGNIYNNTKIKEVSEYDINIIRVRINMCRNYLEKHPDIGLSIYSLLGTTSYMLTDTRKVGSYINIPLPKTKLTEKLTKKEFDFLSDCRVGQRYSLKRRLTNKEFEIFFKLLKNEDDFVPRLRENSTDNNIAFFTLRRKLSGSNMQIIHKSGFGYKLERG
jgi:hypothetical protein